MDRKIALTVRHHLGYKPQFEYAHKAGFKYINFGLAEGISINLLTSPNWEEGINEIVKDLEKYDLKIVMTHAPYYDLRISAEIQDEQLNLAQLNCLRATKMMGATVCAFHPRTHFTDGENLETSYLDNIKNFNPLIELADRIGVKVGIENLPIFPGWSPVFFSCYTKDQNRLIDYYNNRKAVCAVWDTGHSHLMEYDQAQAIREVGDRIEGTHIHNNYKKMDNHFAPALGTIDWEKIMGALKETGYNGYLTTESGILNDDFMEANIKYLYDCMIKVEDIFRNGK